MYHKNSWLTALLALFVATVFIFVPVTNAQTSQKSSAEKPQPTHKPHVEKTEGAMKRHLERGGLEHYLKEAHTLFLRKDLKGSATEIREGAAFLKLEAKQATKERGVALMASADELEKLAAEVEKGAVTSEKDLKDAFARAHHALADYHYQRASESWTKKDAKMTGHELKAATEHLEYAAVWSGHKLEGGTDAAVKGGREASGKLIKGTGWVTEEVSKGIKDVGDEISKLGKEIEPGTTAK